MQPEIHETEIERGGEQVLHIYVVKHTPANAYEIFNSYDANVMLTGQFERKKYHSQDDVCIHIVYTVTVGNGRPDSYGRNSFSRRHSKNNINNDTFFNNSLQ